MCARVEVNHAQMSRGMSVPIIRGRKSESVKWTGFARAERLDWWKRKGAKTVDIPAERFAECSCVSEDLVWEDLEPGKMILGIVIESGTSKVLRVVTREPTAGEILHFQAFRMPVTVRAPDDLPEIAVPDLQLELL
jgi:hypothetical protein